MPKGYAEVANYLRLLAMIVIVTTVMFPDTAHAIATMSTHLMAGTVTTRATDATLRNETIGLHREHTLASNSTFLSPRVVTNMQLPEGAKPSATQLEVRTRDLLSDDNVILTLSLPKPGLAAASLAHNARSVSLCLVNGGNAKKRVLLGSTCTANGNGGATLTAGYADPNGGTDCAGGGMTGLSGTCTTRTVSGSGMVINCVQTTNSKGCIVTYCPTTSAYVNCENGSVGGDTPQGQAAGSNIPLTTTSQCP